MIRLGGTPIAFMCGRTRIDEELSMKTHAMAAPGLDAVPRAPLAYSIITAPVESMGSATPRSVVQAAP